VQVLHRCMAAMLGAAITLTTLAVQHRVPNLAKTVGAGPRPLPSLAKGTVRGSIRSVLLCNMSLAKAHVSCDSSVTVMRSYGWIFPL
jgi:hypothetical protein